MPDDRNWFITERSEALASLMLTSRSDLSVRTENPQDDGVDFVVALNESDNVPTTKFFVVQVKGTLSSDQGDWTENVKQLYKKGALLSPRVRLRRQCSQERCCLCVGC